MSFLVFKTDQGGTYMLENVNEVLTVTGERVRVTYRSEANVLTVTGKVRNQGRMNGAFAYSVGNGSRAVLSLDTDEGVEEIRGVVLAR